jgi:hypothetical protein
MQYRGRVKGREPDNAYAVARPNFEQRLVRGEIPRHLGDGHAADGGMAAGRQRLPGMG